MDKLTEKRFRHPRPQNDFRVDSVALLVDIQERHEKAGFQAIPIETTLRRYWQYLDFLQRNGLTSRTIAASAEDVTEATELRNYDLTDAGFRFIQYSHDRWLGRTYKDKGPQAEEKFLQQWYRKFSEGYAQPVVPPDPHASASLRRGVG